MRRRGGPVLSGDWSFAWGGRGSVRATVHEYQCFADRRTRKVHRCPGGDRPVRLFERGRTGGLAPHGALRSDGGRKASLAAKYAWREGIDSGDAGEIDFAKLEQEA